MSRLAEPNATKEQIIQLLKKKLGRNWEFYNPSEIIPESDLKVKFDFENFRAPWFTFCCDDECVGWYEINGTTVALCYAGGDWEFPVYFAVYLERGGKKLRVYIPTTGNCFNIYLKAALGSEEVYFCEEDLRKLLPEDLMNESRLNDWYRYLVAKIDLGDMLKDIGAEIEGAKPVVSFEKKHGLFYDAKALDEWLKEDPEDIDE